MPGNNAIVRNQDAHLLPINESLSTRADFPTEPSSNKEAFIASCKDPALRFPFRTPVTPLPVGADLLKEYIAKATQCSISPCNRII